MSKLVIPSNYGLPLFSAACLSMECILTGFLVAQKARTQVFTPEFMKENFGEEHLKETGEDVSK